MKTFKHPADQQEVQRRVAQLTKTDAGLWGVMSVHQMVCHLEDSYQVALGRRPARAASGGLKRTLVKWFALRAPMAWPKGIPTLPEVKQGEGGSPPGEFMRDRAVLIATVEHFPQELPSPCLPHAIFGPMTTDDWLRWGYLHADHHLRQFGR